MTEDKVIASVFLNLEAHFEWVLPSVRGAKEQGFEMAALNSMGGVTLKWDYEFFPARAGLQSTSRLIWSLE